ncbi:unnamed protein product, partial [marine sediment metagenome]
MPTVPKQSRRIEICGGIAAGKTSLARLLEASIADTDAIYE